MIYFWKNNIDNIESPISNNISAELQLQVDQQRPTKKFKHKCKAKLGTLKYAYKNAKNKMKTGIAPMTCPFCNDIDDRYTRYS